MGLEKLYHVKKPFPQVLLSASQPPPPPPPPPPTFLVNVDKSVYTHPSPEEKWIFHDRR